MTIEAKKVGRHKTGKMTVAIRLSPRTKAQLDRATVHLGVGAKSLYVEQALIDKFKRDRVQ
jgi:hypothetical protein